MTVEYIKPRFIFRSFFISENFKKVGFTVGSQYSFFVSFFTSFLMVYVYKNDQKTDKK